MAKNEKAEKTLRNEKVSFLNSITFKIMLLVGVALIFTTVVITFSTVGSSKRNIKENIQSHMKYMAEAERRRLNVDYSKALLTGNPIGYDCDNER